MEFRMRAGVPLRPSCRSEQGPTRRGSPSRTERAHRAAGTDGGRGASKIEQRQPTYAVSRSFWVRHPTTSPGVPSEGAPTYLAGWLPSVGRFSTARSAPLQQGAVGWHAWLGTSEALRLGRVGRMPPASRRARSCGQSQAVPSPEPCKSFLGSMEQNVGVLGLGPFAVLSPRRDVKVSRPPRPDTPATRQHLHRRSQPARSGSAGDLLLALPRQSCVWSGSIVQTCAPSTRRGGGRGLRRPAVLSSRHRRMETPLASSAIWTNNSRMHVDRNDQRRHRPVEARVTRIGTN